MVRKNNEGASFREVDLIYNVVEIDQMMGRMYPRRGMATGWLEDLSKQQRATRKKVRKLKSGINIYLMFEPKPHIL